MVEFVDATGLELVYDAIQALSPEGKTFLGHASNEDGLVREVTEGDALPHLTMGTGIAIEKQVIEVGVRGLPQDYRGPRNEALRIRYLICELRNYESRGLRLLTALPSGSILPLGPDGNQREQFTVRFEVWITDATQ